MDNCLQVGIDFSQKGADFCLLFPGGQALDMHQHFANSQSGYEQARAYLPAAMQAHDFERLNVSGEAIGYYWLPFFWQLAHDRLQTQSVLAQPALGALVQAQLVAG